ncbi:MAG TPA: hypothetical protein VII13_02705 [Vicinamibacteria bacterium]
MRLAALAGVTLAAAASHAAGQVQVHSGAGLEGKYGEAEAVELEDLALSGGRYDRSVVRTRGVLDLANEARNHYRLRFRGHEVLILPVGGSVDMRMMMGRQLSVTGLVRELPYKQDTIPGCGPESLCLDPGLPVLPDLADHPGYPRLSISVWSASDLGEPAAQEREAPAVTLESLLSKPGARDGQTVRVTGAFRGHNLFGDLPKASRRRSGDWVIKHEAFAAWVVGMDPKGSGWSLDGDLREDTGKWIEVLARPATRDGVVYLQALRLVLGREPAPVVAAAKPKAAAPARPAARPVVVFAFPVDTDPVPPDTTRFMVQFSKDMDAASFEGRVQLRYGGRPRPGDKPFDAVRVDYDSGRRALLVDPGAVLRAGRQLELWLLPGIVDVQGLELAASAPSGVDGAVAVLRWTIAG